MQGNRAILSIKRSSGVLSIKEYASRNSEHLEHSLSKREHRAEDALLSWPWLIVVVGHWGTRSFRNKLHLRTFHGQGEVREFAHQLLSSGTEQEVSRNSLGSEWHQQSPSEVPWG